MLEIETKLSISFYPQTDGQIERMNQELEQYLQFFIDHRKKIFMANYRRELRMGADIRKKGKVEKVTEFVERMKKIQKEVGAALRRAQEEMKQQADKRRKEGEEWKKGDKVILSTKEFKKQLAKKLVN